MNIHGYYWDNALLETWQELLDKESWDNYFLKSNTTTTDSVTLDVGKVNLEIYSKTKTYSNINFYATRKNYYNSMTDNLPDYYYYSTDVDIFKKMAESELKEIGRENEKIENSIHVINATINNIERFELEYGLTTDKSLPFIFRKNILIASHAIILNDCTEYNLYKVLEFMGATDINIILNPARKLFISLNINVLYLTELTKLVRKFTPAHLAIELTLSKPWEFLLNDGDGTWQNALDNYIWNDFIN